MFEDTRLKIFALVAETGSFTKTASRLGITQPAVSQNISELERAVGGSLFTRTRGAVELTEKGKEFKQYADQILYWYAAAANVFTEGGTKVTPPSVISVDETTSLEISSSQGDVHIKILKK